MTVRILHGDCRAVLPTLADASVQCCVTSPPYYGLRDYGVAGQIGLEPTPDEYVAEMVAVFREVRRVLRDDGTLWLNIGDSYAAQRGGSHQSAETLAGGKGGRMADGATVNRGRFAGYNPTRNASAIGVKHKDLLGIPWLLAFALRADGWYLRSDIIWHKPNPMPESVRDRCTSSYEHVFMLTKRGAYFYDADGIREENANPELTECVKHWTERPNNGEWPAGTGGRMGSVQNGRNARNVWTIATQPYSGAHFATMPPELAERCIKAGSRPGDTVLDPFAGAGTTGLVADRLGRNATLIELNSAYRALATDRLRGDAPLFAEVST